MNSDGLCPECFGNVYQVGYDEYKCDDCGMYMCGVDLIPLPPPITEQDLDFTFAHELSDDEMELINQEAHFLLETLMQD